MLKIINKLEQMNIISRDEAELKILIKKMHLPRSSPVYKAWRNQLKLMAMRKLDDAEDADSYSFSVVFASDTETQNQIRRRFLTFLKEVEKLAGTSAQHDTYQMSFDLFAWTKS